MVRSLVALQNFIEALEEKRPELVQGSIVTNTLRRVRGIVMIGTDHLSTVKLQRHQYGEDHKRKKVTYIDQFSSIFAQQFIGFHQVCFGDDAADQDFDSTR